MDEDSILAIVTMSLVTICSIVCAVIACYKNDKQSQDEDYSPI